MNVALIAKNHLMDVAAIAWIARDISASMEFTVFKVSLKLRTDIQKSLWITVQTNVHTTGTLYCVL